MLKLLKTHWFLLGLAGTISLAAAVPGLDTGDTQVPSANLGRIAVFVIFAINGLILPTESILSGLAKWRVHAFVHAFLFVATPLILLGLLVPVRPMLSSTLISGFILLAALPCTISTSIVYAVRAGGSVAPAIFNATAANLTGVILTPLVVGALAPHSGGLDINPATALGNAATMILPPILLGQLLRPPLRAWATRMKPRLNTMSSLLILVVVYFAFADSVRAGLWTRAEPSALLFIGCVCGVFFLVQITAAAAATRWLNFAADDAITAFVCATQKTLAAGIPLASAIFAATPVDPGLVLLPLLIFYTIQLVLGDTAIRTLCRPVN